jgi:hypothetical protein
MVANRHGPMGGVTGVEDLGYRTMSKIAQDAAKMILSLQFSAVGGAG